MVIRTDKELYVSFLAGIGKPKTGTIEPDEFNGLINEAALNVVKTKLPAIEFNQKRIDDLEFLRVITDGTIGYDPIASSSLNNFDIPKVYTGIDDYILMSNGYPLYLHGLNVMFLVGTTWRGAKVLRIDGKVFLEDNPYRRTSATRIYFEMAAGRIRYVGPLGSSSSSLRLEYFRYPKQVEFVNGNENELEFGPTLSQEISEFAIRHFLEQISSPRQKSFMQEQTIISHGN